ncbi:ubiquinol-cytochrome C chaperone family protein [Desulfonatronum lacustre]|uniref:ubiquinol-cytochrome C chaperone family protein n=1 Tax=Desulfonatronum lacustre TaxID=66849 RepID=UPI001B7F8AC2
MVGIFQAVFPAVGFKSYQHTLIIVNAIMKALIGRDLSFAGNVALTRTMVIFTGPIGWIITGLWTAIDIAGPAYRVTIPAVIQVAALRQKYLYENQAERVEHI